MQDEPSGAELLDVARQVLSREIAPTLTGRPRYLAAMVANAIGIVAREIEHGAAMRDALARAVSRIDPDATTADLAAAIRAGGHDADADLHAALVEATETAAAIWKPPPPGQ
ncbi:DUF6285 domain-containing protein [Methylobacterium planeticum]|uniref:DUF6285 domain-containing protein n=1 Tax=Methylobacterium planeticum TaxID=2615211 RepID=A0A6N6MSY0_9HYPH|nr:DUF6285 domain-containing protein [Methylobacterium planeticum]KAB1074038.1 hypothetical protein F6X51_09980 [Methylobacterium planeticum]